MIGSPDQVHGPRNLVSEGRDEKNRLFQGGYSKYNMPMNCGAYSYWFRFWHPPT